MKIECSDDELVRVCNRVPPIASSGSVGRAQGTLMAFVRPLLASVTFLANGRCAVADSTDRRNKLVKLLCWRFVV